MPLSAPGNGEGLGHLHTPWEKAGGGEEEAGVSGRSWEKAGGLGQSLSWLAGVMSPTAQRAGLWPEGVLGSPVSLVWSWG